VGERCWLAQFVSAQNAAICVAVLANALLCNAMLIM
jgi:hypothetical protein